MDNSYKICRFCYNTYEEEELSQVEEVVTNMLEALHIPLDLSITENPVICSICKAELQECDNLKQMCISRRNYIDLEKTDEIICHLCMESTDNPQVLNDVEMEQLSNFFPEVDLNTSKSVVFCMKCHPSLQKYLSFARICLEWENKLVKTKNILGQDTKISLENFLHSLKYFDPIKEETSHIKLSLHLKEDKLEDLVSIDELFVKQENLIVKAEEFDEDTEEMSFHNDTDFTEEIMEVKDEFLVKIEENGDPDTEMYSEETSLVKNEEGNEKFALSNDELIIKDEAILEETRKNSKMRYRGKRSMVWQFFKITLDNKFVVCNVCKKRLGYFKNTTNLKEHLKRMHPKTLLVPSLNNSKEEEHIASTSTTATTTAIATTLKELQTLGVPTRASSGSAALSVPSCESPLGVRLFNSSRSETELTERQIATLNLKLIKMIAVDYQPLRIVEDEGFREFVGKLNPLYSLPSLKMLSTKLIPSLYRSVVDKLRDKLASVDYVGVTTDLWTSDSNCHYITVTVHYIEDSTLHSNALQTNNVKGSQTGAQIGSELIDIFNKWEIHQKVVTVVTDNGANIKSAINDHLKKSHHPCIAHVLNLSINDCLKQNEELNKILEKCRIIANHFKHNTLAVEKLSRMQQQMNCPQLKVKQDLPALWNSTYIMLQRLTDVKAPITALIPTVQALSMLDRDEWMVVEDCVLILKLLDLMTTALSGEKYVTLSSVIPLVQALQYSINKINCSTAIGNTLKNDLLQVFSRRLGNYEQDKISAKATFLDPRYKKHGFGSQYNADNAEKWVLEELGNLFARDSAPSASAVVVNQVEPSGESEIDQLWEYFDRKVAHSAEVMVPSATTKAKLMVRQYLSMANLPRSANPLAFWVENKNLFPHLYSMHLKYLCAPATSVPSDRIFLKSGLLTNFRRNRLSPKNLDKIIFLNSNL